MTNEYMPLNKVSETYKINRHRLREIARNKWYQKMHKWAVYDTNKGGKKAKYVFHVPTLLKFLSLG